MFYSFINDDHYVYKETFVKQQGALAMTTAPAREMALENKRSSDNLRDWSHLVRILVG